jgi:hypothetical protein
MLAPIDAADRRICDVNPYNSSFGNRLVNLYKGSHQFTAARIKTIQPPAGVSPS